jgi:hypothetical protein
MGVAFSVPVPPDLIIAADGSLRGNLRYGCKVPGQMTFEQNSEVVRRPRLTIRETGCVFKHR